MLSAFLVGIMHVNNSSSLLIARICSVPNEKNSEGGSGFLRACDKICAASISLSVTNVAGMSMSCGKGSIVCTIRSALVLVM